jgi:hypothetical protein
MKIEKGRPSPRNEPRLVPIGLDESPKVPSTGPRKIKPTCVNGPGQPARRCDQLTRIGCRCSRARMEAPRTRNDLKFGPVARFLAQGSSDDIAMLVVTSCSEHTAVSPAAHSHGRITGNGPSRTTDVELGHSVVSEVPCGVRCLHVCHPNTYN